MRRKITNLFYNINYKSLFNIFKFENSSIENKLLNSGGYDFAFKEDVNNELTKIPSLLRNDNKEAELKYIEHLEYNLFKKVKKTDYEMLQTGKRNFSITPERNTSKIKPVIKVGGDFADIVTKSDIFIDKSLFIKEIIKDESEAVLITMPRRWGKSLNLNMLKRFLSIEVDEKGGKIRSDQTDNYKLFAGGEIDLGFGDSREIKSTKIFSDEYCMKRQGQYPVIFIDFKDCKGNSLEDVKNKVKNKIIETVRNFSYLQKSESQYKETTLGVEYLTLLNKVKNDNFSTAIKELSVLLHAYHNQKVWILIDEYDAAANKAYLEFDTEDAKQISDIFRDIFESALKGNEHLEKGVMTGVQYIIKSGMLSGLNNLAKYNIIDSRYAQYYGINQEEMSLLLKCFAIEENSLQADEIRSWYNGYKEKINTGEFIDKYNIWSVINYLNKQEAGYKSYWENNSLSDVINKGILKHPDVKHIIEGLINNIPLVLHRLTTDFDINNFKELKSIIQNHDTIEIKQDGIDLLFSYLFVLGYLTITPEVNEYVLPNKEIRIEFENKLKDFYNQIFNISPSKFNELTKTLDSILSYSDRQKMVDDIKNKFSPMFTDIIKTLKVYNDSNDNLTTKGVFGNEDLMHSLLNNIALQIVNAKFATERYTTISNKEKGIADILLSKNGKGIVIEMKYNKQKTYSDPKKQANDALKQAKDYGKLIEDNPIKIFLGLNVTDAQEVYLAGEIQSDDNTTSFEYP